MKLNEIRLFIFLVVLVFFFFLTACTNGTNFNESTNCDQSDKTSSESNKSQKGIQLMGIDVSHHNGDIDWNILSSNEKLSFVYIKATEGATYLDKNYFKNVEGAFSAGLPIGSYHFFRMTSSAHSQFNNFDRAMKKAGKQSLIPMVDVETNDKFPIKELRDSLNVFISLIKDNYGVYPMIYGTNRSYNTYCGSVYNKYHLYIGRYGNNPPVINGRGHYTVWQFSEKGQIPGIPKPVDLAKFHPKYDISDISLP